MKQLILRTEEEKKAIIREYSRSYRSRMTEQQREKNRAKAREYAKVYLKDMRENNPEKYQRMLERNQEYRRTRKQEEISQLAFNAQEWKGLAAAEQKILGILRGNPFFRGMTDSDMRRFLKKNAAKIFGNPNHPSRPKEQPHEHNGLEG